MVSAAYAAFRPSAELTKIINSTLISLVDEGKITPEKCYLLKVNPIAQRLFAKNTANNPDNFIDSTPFEILKELEESAFEQGSVSRQEEIDSLNAVKNEVEIQLAIEKQNAIIKDLKHQIAITEAESEKTSDTIKRISRELDELNAAKAIIDDKVSKRMKLIRILLTVIIIITFAGSIAISIISELWLAILPFALSVYGIIVSVWKDEHVSIYSLLLKYEKRFYDRQCALRRYSDAKVLSLQNDKEESEQHLIKTQSLIQTLYEQLKEETEKIDCYSIDISCVSTENPEK